MLRAQRLKSIRDNSVSVNGDGMADIIVQSSDGVQFHLHRRYLEVNTGALPGVDSDSAVELQSGENINEGAGDVVIYLPEPASVLEVVFEFVYPRKHVTMFDQRSGAWGETKVPVLPIAEAAEKYKVYPLMAATITAMRGALSLAHVKGRDLERLLRLLPVYAAVPWICYQQSWREIFALAKRFIGPDYYDTLKAFADGSASDIPAGYLPSCKRCEMNLLGWVANIETQFDQKLTRMRVYLDGKRTDVQEQLYNCQLCCKAELSPSGTIVTEEERKRWNTRDFTVDCILLACDTVIQSMPRFSQFLENCTVVRYRAVVKKDAEDGGMVLTFHRI
ncbi:hypothetical protein CPC08DRAFT_804988 [Agrocybe pediades]|nr:hypothetical protein CPC08DRAFT_804988 [Agrocybe pediades]